MSTELVGQLGGLTVEEWETIPRLTEKLIGVMKALNYDTGILVSFHSSIYQSKA